MHDKIQKTTPNIQVLYNRCLVQLGIAAFRKLRIMDTFSCLHDIIFTGKSKELLAQGLSRNPDKSVEEEKKEMRRQLPPHMHINIEVIEGILLICSMILDVTNLSGNLGSKRKIVNKFFKKEVDRYDRLIYTGPSENTKEKIIVASRYLNEGEWKKCEELIMELNIWKNITDKNEILPNLTTLIKQESLRAYILTKGHYFDALSLSNLASSFDLPKNKVHSIVSKMILTKEVEGSLDQTEDCFVMQTEDTSLLQKLAFSYAEKMNVIQEIQSYETAKQNKWNDNRQKSDQQKRPYDSNRGKKQRGGKNQPFRGGKNQSYRGEKKKYQNYSDNQNKTNKS